MNEENVTKSDFIRTIVEEDLETGKHATITTRFPPEPNGYPHIGHAKAISINFGIARQFGGKCNLRFDDTNPEKEKEEYVDAIKRDISWLGYEWDRELFASDYYLRLYELAEALIKKGSAFVCSLNTEQMREYRGTLTEPGKNSPDRDRSVEENLELFQRMRAGDFDDGEYTLRAKIDMSSPNMNMRDPAIYRIKKATHHRTGDEWCIYPMYDYAHGLSDAFESITHSLCSLEFEDHRPLYDWFIDQLLDELPAKPRQIEFARLFLSHTVTSKRKLRKLVEDSIVDGWDDPRMPTLSGYRRAGFPPEAIRDFCDRIGVSKANSLVPKSFLQFCARENLNQHAQRRMAVLNPLKVVIENYPEGQEEMLEATNNPNDPDAGKREIPFSRELYIEREDFLEDAPKKFFRFSLGREVRLQHAYYVTCTEVVKDEASGEVVELRCSYDPESRGGTSPDGRKVKGTVHWVSVAHAKDAEVRIFDELFSEEEPDSFDDFLTVLNPDSKRTLTAKIEPSLALVSPEERFQFLRMGYFVSDIEDHSVESPVFNQIVPLREAKGK